MQQRVAISLLSLALCGACTRECLLDDYRLVDADEVPMGGFPSVGGSGGTGGGEAGMDACDTVVGAVVVVTNVEPGDNAAEPCVTQASAEGGIELMAFDPGDGACVSHARILRQNGATSSVGLRVSYSADEYFHVAGSYLVGSLELPSACSDSAAVTIDTELNASVTHFVARIQRTGLGMCTEWVRRLWTSEAVTPAVHDVASDASGGVALSGTLDGGAFEFEDGTATTAAQGRAFLARYDVDGALVGVETFGEGSFDAAYGASQVDADWLVTGTLQNESPACHGCNGTTAVIDPAGECPTGAGGGGGAGLPDSHNAWLWSRFAADVNCASFRTYGTDTSGIQDAQVGYHAAARRSATGCLSYWTGISGSDAWPFDAADANSALDDLGGPTADGFLFALGGDDCGSEGTHVANIRMQAPLPGLASWGNRVVPTACAEGVMLSAFVVGGATSLELHRCADGTCAESDVSLPGGTSQLVVAKLGADITPSWSGAFAPVDVDTVLVDDAYGGQVRDNLALDGRDHVYLGFATLGALAVAGVDTANCSELEGGASGTFLVALEPDGSGSGARCSWAHRTGL